jgi:hypothetical protein
MQRDDALELVSQMSTPARLTSGESLLLATIGRWQMVDTGQESSKELSIIDDATNRNTAEADAVITAFPPDETSARTFAADIVVSKRDL